MDITLYYLLCVCIIITPIEVTSNLIHEHIQEKFNQHSLELHKFFNQQLEPVLVETYDIYWEQLWNSTSLKTDSPLAIKLFDGMYVLDGNRIMSVSINTAFSNETNGLSQVSMLDVKERIKFAKAVIWKSMLYLLICHERGPCTLYTAVDEIRLSYRQTLMAMNAGQPTDANFFTQANKLYLVVARKTGQYPVPSTIYHWTGTYMDVVNEILTTGALSVTTFRHEQLTIIVFVQNDLNNSRIGSEVYEFKSNIAERIQFLSTDKPSSVHHYYHDGHNYVLITNEAPRPSSLYWWDGRELILWNKLVQVQANSIIRVTHVYNTTLLIVGNQNTITVYQILQMSDELKSLNVKDLKEGHTIMDMSVLINKDVITLLLVTENSKNIYCVETWSLLVKNAIHESKREGDNAPAKCFNDLMKLLAERRSDAESANETLQFLHRNSSNATTNGLRIPSILIENRVMNNVDLSVSKEILMPDKLDQVLEILNRDVDGIIELSRKTLEASSNPIQRLNHDVVTTAAYFDELYIDSLHVETINNDDGRLYMSTSDEGAQQFSRPLQAKNVFVDDLRIDSHCGLPFEFWAKPNTKRGTILVQKGNITFSENTVSILTDTKLSILTTEKLNNVDITNFLNEELYVFGRNNKIIGNITYKNVVSISNLTTEMINNVISTNLMTKATEQYFNNFSIHTAKIDKLYANVINKVSVAKAARVSQENTIQGKIWLRNITTDTLLMEGMLNFPYERPLQVYQNVTIYGEIKLKGIELDSLTTLSVSNNSMNFKKEFDKYWRKSNEQTIQNTISFDRGITIDSINTKYLNEHTIDEFLYTNVHDIPESFKNLHMGSVSLERSPSEEEEGKSLYKQTSTELFIKKKLHLPYLSVTDLAADKFNGIKIEDILNKNTPIKLGDVNYLLIKVINEIETDNLKVVSMNNGNEATSIFLDKLLSINDHYHIDLISKVNEICVNNITIQQLNNLNISRLLNLENDLNSFIKNIIIKGDLKISKNLNVSSLNNQAPELFLKNIVTNNSVLPFNTEIKNLSVDDVSLHSVFGNKSVDALFKNILSKSKVQKIPGKFSFYKVNANLIEAEKINDITVRDLNWIDQHLEIPGNVTFTNLILLNDIMTKSLNNHPVIELYDNISKVPLTNIINLQINGSLSWNMSKPHSYSMSYLYDNIVTKNTNQVIHGKLAFTNNILSPTVYGIINGSEEIQKIVDRALIDNKKNGQQNAEVLIIRGNKVFAKGFTVDNLIVENDIDISVINDVNILDFNNSVVKKYKKDILEESLIFLLDIKINKLYTNRNIHNVPINSIAFSTKALPSNIIFQDLHVREYINVQLIDNVNFTKFLKERISLNDTQEIFSNVQFNGILQITDNCKINRIEGVNVDDWLLNNTDKVQSISSVKIFSNELKVEGNVNSKYINNENLNHTIKSSIMNNENSEIHGNLVIQSISTITGNITISKFVNDEKLDNILINSNTRFVKFKESLQENNNKIDDILSHGVFMSTNLSTEFAYLEKDNRLNIPVTNINKINTVNIEPYVKLNMIGELSGDNCGLPIHCSCPFQYNAELSKNYCKTTKLNGNHIMRNFYEINGTFGINVITNILSSSDECESINKDTESTAINWSTQKLADNNKKINIINNSTISKKGFVKDASVFINDDDIYIILAIYYDPIKRTHKTHSLLYKLNLKNPNLLLHQLLYTDGAWAIDIFKIGNYSGKYLLIGCYGNSKKSLLYRFNVKTAKFEDLRSFPSKSWFVKSAVHYNDYFVLLDDADMNAVNIYRYSEKYDNFFAYQSFYHNSKVNSIEVFYSNKFGNSDLFVLVTTNDGKLHFYQYMLAEQFQKKAEYWIEGLQTAIPFYLNKHKYIFMGSSTNSTMWKIIERGPST
ncbi:protein PF3D7_1417600 [Prorops nasuta]|uniref:protein PF3D7_1417600 n=1 Tax=Prorops nasuta TaxID=863751 RepID=UPI0034CD7E3A